MLIAAIAYPINLAVAVDILKRAWIILLGTITTPSTLDATVDIKEVVKHVT